MRGGNNKHCYFLTEKEIYANDMLRDDLTVKLHLVYGVDLSAAEQQKPNKVCGNRVFRNVASRRCLEFLSHSFGSYLYLFFSSCLFMNTELFSLPL